MVPGIIRIGFIFILNSLYISGQTYTSWYTGNNSDKIAMPAGGICLMGGATENDEAMKWFLTQCSGGDVLVLRASGSNGYNNYLFSELGVQVNSVETILFKSRAASEETYIHQKIRQAEGIWFAGGDQWDYVSFWRNTKIDSLINEAIQTRHIAIGGTSAGMAIMGGFYFSARNGTVTSTEALLNPYNQRVTIDSAEFLNNFFLQNVITDTHYDDPDRKGRHVVFLARILKDWGIPAKGIACDAYSAVCIDTAGLAHCYGNYLWKDDFIYFLQTNCENNSIIPENCSSDSPLEWDINNNSIKVYKSSGTKTGENTFNLCDWKTGSGGIWEDWYVNGGILSQLPGNQISCNVISKINSTNGNQVSFYPNPSVGAELRFNNPSEGVIEISFFNIYGKCVKIVTGNSLQNNLIDISGIAAGIYLIQIETISSILQSRLIVN